MVTILLMIQVILAGVASVTPEDGIGQADVDSAYADGYEEGALSVTPDDGVTQEDVDNAYDDGYGAGYNDGFAAGEASMVPLLEGCQLALDSCRNNPQCVPIEIDLLAGWNNIGYTLSLLKILLLHLN